MSERPGGHMRQELNQRQGLLLTPALKQSLQLLAMPLLELAEFAAAQAEENPVLELFAEDEPEYPSAYYGPENSDYRPEPAVSDEQSLYSLLRLQLATREAATPLRQAALQIIEHLDEDGYFTLALPRLAELCACPEELLAEALILVQSLEPPGVAARDMRECLSLQISTAEPQRELLLTIIGQYLPQVARNRSREVARALNTPLEQVETAFACIRCLHPRPAAALSSSTAPTPYIVPDIIIREIDGVFVAALNEALEPRLQISGYYRRLTQQLQPGDQEARAYLRQKFSAAEALISGMEKRRQTLTQLAQITAYSQRGFLRQGLKHLAPLTMKEVARRAGLHESTVSRAVAGKYVQTPRGVYEWKFFFPRAYETSGGIVTPALAKQQLARLIAGEDKKFPYSDQQLSELLAGEGLHLARRTVAKYREELRLPPRYLRRGHSPKSAGNPK